MKDHGTPDLRIDDPLPPAIVEAARSLYAAPGTDPTRPGTKSVPGGADAYWSALEQRVMSRIANAAAGRWWMVLGGWARSGLVSAAAAIVAAVVGLLLWQAHEREVSLAYESVTQVVPAESIAIPTGALSERDGPDTRGATFRDVISQ